MLAGDSAVFETYQKRTTLISEWGRVARYHSRVGHRRCWTAAASKGLLSLVCVLVLVAVRFGSWTMMAELCFSVDDFIVLFSSNFSNSSNVIASFPLPSASALCVKLCLTDRVWVDRPKRTSNHERLCIHETAGTPSVTLAVVVTRTLLCNDSRAVRVSLPEPVQGLLFFFLGGDVAVVHTYLHIRILGAELIRDTYVCGT